MSGPQRDLDLSHVVADYEKPTGKVCACGCGKPVFAVRETRRYASRLCRNRAGFARTANDPARRARDKERTKARAAAERAAAYADPQEGRPSVEEVQRRIFGEAGPHGRDFAPTMNVLSLRELV